MGLCDAALPALHITLSIFVVPSWRRKRGARRFADSMLGVTALLGVTGALAVLHEADSALGPFFRRMELAEPRTVDGIAFPAAKKLQLERPSGIGDLPRSHADLGFALDRLV